MRRGARPSRVPHLTIHRADGRARAVILVVHGGARCAQDIVRPWSLPYLRMVHLARSLHAAVREHDVEVCVLRNRLRGWNAPELDALADGRWTLRQLRARHPGSPVAVVGHSLGGRVAFRLADDPQVTAVCALAPLVTEREWVSPLQQVRTVLAHGVDDVVTSPQASHAYAARAAALTTVRRFEIRGEGHRMLRRPGTWTRLVRAFAAEAFGLPTADRLFEHAARAPDPLRIPL